MQRQYRVRLNTELIVGYMWRNKLSKTAFCKKCNISYSVLTKMLSDQLNFGFNSVVKVCKLLNVELKDIFVKNEKYKENLIK